MAPNNKQKYINYAINAIHCLRREDGLTITNIVHHIKRMTEENQRFRPLFDQVRAATDHGVSTGVLTRHGNRIQLRSDNDAMSSGDESDTSDEDSGLEDVEEDDASSVGSVDNEAGSSSDDCDQREMRKPVKRVNKKQQQLRARPGVKRRHVDASSDDCDQREMRKPVKRVNKKQQQLRARPGVKRRHVDASSDDESDSDADEDSRIKKRKIVPRKKAKRGGERLKVCEVDKDVALIIPQFKIKVEVVEVEEQEVEDSSAMERLPFSTLALDAGRVGNMARKHNGSEGAEERGSGVGDEWSGSHRMIREEVDEERLRVPGASGTRGERWMMRTAKKERAEEETKNQDGGRNEACGSTVKVKVEKVDKSK